MHFLFLSSVVSFAISNLYLFLLSISFLFRSSVIGSSGGALYIFQSPVVSFNILELYLFLISSLFSSFGVYALYFSHIEGIVALLMFHCPFYW